LEEALINLKVPIEENNAIITHDPLPTINRNKQLKVQLFQNLIGNAIKYRSQETPKIHISATKEKTNISLVLKIMELECPLNTWKEYLSYSNDSIPMNNIWELELD